MTGIATTAQAQAVTLRFASEAARSDPQFAGGEKFGELLKAKTNGAMDVKVYAESSLGMPNRQFREHAPARLTW